jgi:hypothetical protein
VKCNRKKMGDEEGVIGSKRTGNVRAFSENGGR